MAPSKKSAKKAAKKKAVKKAAPKKRAAKKTARKVGDTRSTTRGRSGDRKFNPNPKHADHPEFIRLGFEEKGLKIK